VYEGDRSKHVTQTVGVAVPTLNSAEFLEIALLSLERQREVRVHVIVADSGSTDGTLDICTGRGIETFFVPKGNMYQAINEAIRRLKDEWVAYLNSDDLLYADAYGRLLAATATDGADVAYASADYIDRDGRFLFSLQAPDPHLLERFFRYPVFPFAPHCAVFRRDVFERVEGFSERFRHIADMDFYARALRAGFRFAFARGMPIGAFRLSADQLSRREADVVRREKATLLGDRRSGPPVSSSLAVLRWKLANAPQYLVRRLRRGHWRGV
jgi:glycosyltransferase involved in cell wall biosynthesis